MGSRLLSTPSTVIMAPLHPGPTELHTQWPIPDPRCNLRLNSGMREANVMADSAGSIVPRGPRGIWKATLWSLKGLRACWNHESSFRLEVYLFVVLAPIGLWLGEGAIERVLLVGSMLLVLSAELLNSAVEAVIERYGAEHHELAGRAKDMGSAAVFVLMMNVLLVWGLLLAPTYLLPLLGGG